MGTRAFAATFRPGRRRSPGQCRAPALTRQDPSDGRLPAPEPLGLALPQRLPAGGAVTTSRRGRASQRRKRPMTYVHSNTPRTSTRPTLLTCGLQLGWRRLLSLAAVRAGPRRVPLPRPAPEAPQSPGQGPGPSRQPLAPAPPASPLPGRARHAAPACSAGGTVPREHGEADVNAGEPRGQSLESFVSDKSVTDEVGWENWQGWPCLGTLGTAKDKPGQRCCPQGPPGSQGPLAASSGPPSSVPSAAPRGPPLTCGQ